MPPHPSTVAAHIRFLLDTLDLSNFDPVLRELCQIVEYGTESSIQLLQAFAYQVNFHEGDSQIKVDLFARVVRYMMDRPNFSTIFSEAFENLSIDEGFLRDLSKTLRLSTLEKISIGLALSDSLNLDLRIQGQNFCIVQIEELCANPFVVDSHEKVHDIVTFLSQSQNFSKYVDSFTKMLSLVELNKNSCVLSPMLADDISDTKFLRHLDLLYDSCESGFDSLLSEIEKELNVADVMKELGYGCTFDESHCQNILSLVPPLNELTLSRVIGTVAQTHTGLDDNQNMYSTFCTAIGSGSILDMSCLNSWNIDALVHSIKLLAPDINWMTVMENLDHEGFYIPDEHSFYLFMSIYKKACQDPFPLHAICGSVWKNAEGQLSFLRYAVSASSETFTFAHSSRKLSVLCSQSGLNLPPANENESWLCLDLLEVLCQLAERGHTNRVREIIEYPIQHCPDILLIGLAYLTSDFNFLQHEVSFSVLPALLQDANRNNTLQILWKLNPRLVLFGFINVHVTDPDSMINILDTCLELKILSTVLERAPFSFSIKLAVLASKKEIISFENWLNENISVYKDLFYKECFNFWRGISKVVGEHQHTTTVGKIYAESCAVFLKVLQAIEQPMAQQLVDEMKQLQISSGSINSVPPEGSSEVVDAEANAYFHQMFSGQLSVEAMVQMLARFKDSTIEREKSIFECIIGNIFDEYKFYPKYPEIQLKIAAVLFGSVIKHKLVGHLTLGMALRNVLDALRKSVDSKMFLFGAKALEQFIDRLVEWPQYCNHILQISHLRSTRPELVNFIERALARVSSGQVETSGANNAPIDQNQVSTLQENIEASEASWQLVNSVQLGFAPSPHQQQSKHQGLLDDKQKASVAPANYVKPFVTSAAQPLVGSLIADTINNSQKGTSSQPLPAVPSQTGANGPLSVPQSPGLFRSSRGLASSGMPRQHSYNTGFGSALNIETLVAAAEKRDTPVDAPGSDVQDKIFFMINNISAANMDTKAKEFTEILKEQYYPWFAQYMVMKRASIEPNFHDLYLKFLDKVNSRSLNQEIVKATYENCKVLLRSELIKSSSEERSLLKNLGSWLGKFTIGRNQALRAREIDPKLLIIEAYEKGLMIAVIPFTSKILEPCQSSLAYQPPNPWTMGILSLLAEIYALPNLKMNLKFDIEVLFKNLGVDMKDVKPTSLLKDRHRETEGNPDFSTKDLGVTQPNAANDGNAGVISALNQVDLQPDITNSVLSSGHVNALSQYNNASIHLTSSSLGEDEKIGPLNLPERLPSVQGLSAVSPSQPSYQLATAIPNIGGQIVVNNKLDSLGLNGRFHRVIQVALDKSVKEIMVPIVGRSVKIAMNTTMELVLKDFAMESDENRVYNAARLMVASLAGSLAHVTCKELLRTALTANIKSLLQSMNANGELEQAIQLMTNDNLDLGCALIEQSATEKAMQTIDGEMAPQLSQRRKLREGLGSQLYDAATYTQGPFARVPEALRPKPGRLSIAQQRVYEDFIRFPWQNQSAQNSSIMPSGVSGQSSGSTNPGLARVYTSSGQLNTVYPTAQGAQGFGAVAQQIDFIPEEIDHGSSPIMSSTSLVGTSEGGLQHAVDVNAANPPFNSAVMPVELHPMETSSVGVAHESGTFMSSSAPSDRLVVSVAEPSLSTGDALDKYLIVVERLDSLIAKDAADTDIQGVIAELPEILLRCNGRDEAALAVAQRVFQRLYENASNSLHVASYISLLVAIRDVCKLVVKELTNWVIYSNEERKLNKDITIGLIRSELLNLAEFDVHLAKLVDGGRNKAATDFAISLVKTLVLQEPTVSVSELYNVIDALTKLAMRPGSPESLQQLVEIAKNPSASSNSLTYLNIGKDDKLRQSKDKKVPSGSSVANRDDFNSTEGMVADPTGFRDQVSAIFSDWCQICEHPAATDAARLHLISQIHQSGLLKGDDMTDRFFRILMELSLAHCLSTAEVINSGILAFNTSQQVQFSFMVIDMFEKLIVSVLKFCVVEQASAKTSFLSKILGVMARVIQKDADEKKSSFNPRPHFRLFVYLLLDLNSSDPVFDGFNFLILTSFANAFHALQPLRVPSFSFAWLELISHRSFMPKLLMSPAQKGWPFVQRLLIDLFKFMEPYLRSAELGESVQHLYRGTLRVLLVLLHDFPEFLCDYHFSFCDVIPASCIQMRNVILSAFPHNMRLPDPSTPNLKIDLLAEIGQSPNILSEVDAALKAKQLKLEIDDYLKTRQGSSLMADLKQRLLLPQSEAAMAGTRYNVPLINSLVLYVGMQAIQQMQNKSPPPSQMSHALPMDLFLASAAMDVYKPLIRDLDAEGRYLVLNAIANQLRYPNNHTHYFSFVLLFLFAEANQDIIQEQITRVLFERLIVNRPHPWGLLITFIELIKNPRYDFWSRPFTRCTPEIQALFENVSRSCGGSKAMDDSMVSGAI